MFRSCRSVSKYRDGLYPLEPFTPEQLGDTIDLIEKWQKKIYAEHGIHFIHASDEFYMGAGRPLPEADRYDGYIQLENGVGMIRLMEEEIAEALEQLHPGEAGEVCPEEISIATGRLAAPYIEQYVERVPPVPGEKVHVYAIRNDFGEADHGGGADHGKGSDCTVKGTAAAACCFQAPCSEAARRHFWMI